MESKEVKDLQRELFKEKKINKTLRTDTQVLKDRVEHLYNRLNEIEKESCITQFESTEQTQQELFNDFIYELSKNDVYVDFVSIRNGLKLTKKIKLIIEGLESEREFRRNIEYLVLVTYIVGTIGLIIGGYFLFNHLTS